MTYKRRTKVTIASQPNESVCKNHSTALTFAPHSLSLSLSYAFLLIVSFSHLTAMFTQTLKIVDKQMFCQARSKACRKSKARGDSLIGIPTDKVPKSQKYAHTHTHKLNGFDYLYRNRCIFERRAHSMNGLLWNFWFHCSTDVFLYRAVCCFSVAHNTFCCVIERPILHTIVCMCDRGGEREEEWCSAKGVFFSVDEPTGHKSNHFVQE